MNAGSIYALIIRLTANKSHARSLTKKVFVTTYEQISFFRFDKTFASWLKGVAVFTVLEAMRENKFPAEEDSKKELLAGNINENTESPGLLENAFEEDIFSLPEKERIAFILHDLEEYTDEETADLLFTNKEEIKNILERAYQILITKNGDINSVKSIKDGINALSDKIEPPAGLWKEIFAEMHRLKAQKIKEQIKVKTRSDEQAEEDIIKPRKRGKHWAGELKEQTVEDSIFVKNKSGFGFIKSNSLKIGSLIGILIILLIAVYFIFIAGSKEWNVSSVKGIPLLNGKDLNGISHLAVGDILKTNGSSKALIKIPEIGQIEIQPGTILRRLEKNFTLKMEIGKINVNENSTAESLTVDIPNASINDFTPGSNYSISLNDAGTAFLYVKKSWEKIKDNKFSTFVTPGFYCEIVFGRGAGVPYSKNSSKEFADDITRFSFNTYTTELLDRILSEAKRENAVSLWNMIERVNSEDRIKVVVTLEKLVPLPQGVSEDSIITLNDKALINWLKKIAA